MRRLLAIVAVVAGAATATVLVLRAAEGAEDDGRCTSIDYAAFRASSPWVRPGGGETARQRIAEDMVACGSLVGEPVSTARRLLGRPDTAGEESWHWVTGPDAIGLEQTVLILTFDDQRRVVRVSAESI